MSRATATCSLTDRIEAALAAWRLAHMLVHEDGPWAIFARLRYQAGLRSVAVRDGEGNVNVARVAANTWAEGLTCVWCVSVWTATLLGMGDWRWVRWARRVLAVSAGAIIVHEVVQWLRSR